MAENMFNEGDIVRLKSGGPEMMVKEYRIQNDGATINAFLTRGSGRKGPYDENEKKFVICTWFDGKKNETKKFEELLLEFVRRF